MKSAEIKNAPSLIYTRVCLLQNNINDSRLTSFTSDYYIVNYVEFFYEFDEVGLSRDKLIFDILLEQIEELFLSLISGSRKK